MNGALNGLVRGTLDGDIGDALQGAAGGFLRNVTTGIPAVDNLIRQLGGIFAQFGGRTGVACGGQSLGSVIVTLFILQHWCRGSLTELHTSWVSCSWSGVSSSSESMLRCQIRYKSGTRSSGWPQVVCSWPYRSLWRRRATSVDFGINQYDGSSFDGSGATGAGLDAMLVALMRDIWIPTKMLLLGFCYLAGIFLVMVAISRMLKSEQDGPKGPTGIGTFATFLTAGALFSVDRMLVRLPSPCSKG